MAKMRREEIIAELFQRGQLSYKLHIGQRVIYDLYWNNKEKLNTWLIGRRWGKSFTLHLLSIEECLRKPNVVVKLVAPTKAQMETISRPLINKILEDCPEHLKPKYNSKITSYTFYNGSQIQLAGNDSGHAERLRGGFAHVCFIDEAGTCDNLKYLVNDILLPTTLTTGGKVIIVGTPPQDLEHDFLHFIRDARFNGTLVTKPTKDNPLIPPDEYEKLEQSLGGRESETARRELYCEIMRSEKFTVFPEFDEELKQEIIKEVAKPQFYDTYESMDLGYKDRTGLLFGYYDFKTSKVVIEDELLVNFQEKDVSIPYVVSQIDNKEKSLWYNSQTVEIKPVYQRITDINNPTVSQEFGKASNYRINFVNVQKDELEPMVNQVRLMLGQRKIIIHPRCKQLIAQLEFCKWRKSLTGKREFDRSEVHSHYDLAAALIYLIRSINYSRNPYPAHYNLDPKDLFVVNRPNGYKNNNGVNEQLISTMKNIFRPNIKKIKR